MKTGADAESLDFDLTNEMNTTGENMTAEKVVHQVNIDWAADPQGPEMMGYNLPLDDEFFPDGIYDITSARPSNILIHTEDGEWENEVSREILNNVVEPLLLKIEMPLNK